MKKNNSDAKNFDKMKKDCGGVGIFKKILIYLVIGIHVLAKYRKHLSIPFIYKASILLFSFWHNKLIKLQNGTYKLHLYLPAYPTKAFFKSVEDKLICTPPLPITIVYSITKACTFKCLHCYQRKDKGEDIELNLVLKTIKDIQDAGVAFLNIEGGDAFLKFDTLSKILDSLDDSMEVWVNTTGANVTKEKLQILKDKGMCGLMVSIHNTTPKKHDNFVNVDGAYNMAISTLNWCKEIGLSSAINTVLENDKIKNNELSKIMELAKNLCVNFVQVIHPKRAGLWLSNEELSKNDNLTIDYVLRAHKYYNSSFKKGYPALPAQVEEEQPHKFGCTAGGIDRFYIGASGEVQPCEFLNISFGNVKEEEFNVIFNRMRKAFSTPRQDWLCQNLSSKIYNIMKEHNITKTPIPYEYTKKLLENMEKGEPTKLYKKLGIYK